MISKPVLDKFEIKGIQDIHTFEKRTLVEQRVPGMEGSLFQDLGTEPALITIRGSLNYSESRQDVLNLEELRKKFQAAQAVPFVADITTATKIKEVLIKDIEIRESEELPEYFDYFIELREHIPEPPPSNVQGNVNEEAQERHDTKVKQVKKGVVVLEVSVELEKGEDFSKIKVQISDNQGNIVDTINNNTSGIFTSKELPTGDYDISVIRG